ncbi:short-chain dehydrogenase [Fusarium albosuccineum]|uniref:Short-chain dehydrogenase n=1 Tax=Fusarium albosuccineum TaxID=1237068 RepID=A0A8H4KZX8_9HYPO|nr:short-chain dehydrogenase [Fusarium albosuccineum]
MTAPTFTSLSLATDVSAAFPESVKGKTIVITGVSPNSLGLATAFALAAQEPERLILTGRSADKVQASIDNLKSSFPGVKYDSLLFDLSSQASVRAAAAKLNDNSDIPEAHILINNAGVMAIAELTLSDDDIEMSFATNHIGHFLFTNLIIGKLIAASKTSSTPTRIINLTSFGHQFSPIRFSDINFTKKPSKLPEEERPDLQKAEFFYGRNWANDAYAGGFSYAQSKTANVLFSISLNQKLASQYGITSYAVHPGAVDTNIGRHSNPEEVLHALNKAKELGFTDPQKTPEQGANSSVWAAVNPGLPPPDLSEDVVKGVYVADCKLPDEGCAEFAKRKVLAERLWELSETLVNQKFL